MSQQRGSTAHHRQGKTGTFRAETRKAFPAQAAELESRLPKACGKVWNFHLLPVTLQKKLIQV